MSLIDSHDLAGSRAQLTQELIEEFGSPLFVLNVDALRVRANEVAQRLSVSGHTTRILYSFKTNYVPFLVDTLLKSGMGADVVSAHELELAIGLGASGFNLALNGPMKTAHELQLTLNAGGVINVDSLHDLELLAEIDPQRRAVLGLRLNPAHLVYETKDSAWREDATQRAAESKFGWLIDDGSAAAVVDRIEDLGYSLQALHVHLGSQVDNAAGVLKSIDSLVGFAQKHCAESIQIVNFGGGMCVSGLSRRRGSDDKEHELPTSDFDYERVTRHIATALSRAGLEKVDVAFEPGRAIVSAPISLLTTVVSRKTTSAADWLLLDAGLNILPTFAMDERRLLERVSPSPDATSLTQVDVGGPLCYEGDVLMRGLGVPSDTKPGDVFELSDAGAYTVSRSTNFIRSRAAMVALRGERAELVWRRETTSDVYMFDTGYAKIHSGHPQGSET